MTAHHAFAILTPDYVMDALDNCGFVSDGRLLALNSYENRVYQVGVEDGTPLIIKFYRPGRWTDEQILEEHAFAAELQQHGVSAVPPLLIDGRSLITDANGMRFALFERRGGRAPALDNLDNLHILGQHMGRMHRIGQAQDFVYRPALTVADFGQASVDFISEQMIPGSLKPAYQSLCRDLLQLITEQWQALPRLRLIRCHGDCHLGNILWRDDAPHFVDFDDARMAPAIQDLWMLLSGDRNEQTLQLAEIVDGYAMFHDFDSSQLALIEPLRTLRMMHHAAWLGRRWDDPAFPMHFPWFNSERYWGEHILQLREQFFALQQAPLQLMP
ncbi:MAG TPA: serine/threonine protein kinase [Pseudomonadales bacterium]